MKTIRIAALLTACCVMLCMLCACGGTTAPQDSDTTTTTTTAQNTDEKVLGFQLEAPAVGEEIAVMHTSMGDVYIRFFPDQAPKAVENFKTLAGEGYYDGIVFHRVIDSFMIQGGDPTATGAGGESCWGEDFEDEFDPSLGNLRGSLAMANSGVNTNGSQFFINMEGQDGVSVKAGREYYLENKDMIDTHFGGFEEFYAANLGLDVDKLTEEVLKVYEEVGGNIYLDGPLKTSGGHTVFGQVFKGMDVVDAIGEVETDESDRPLEDVVILGIDLVTYEG